MKRLSLLIFLCAAPCLAQVSPNLPTLPAAGWTTQANMPIPNLTGYTVATVKPGGGGTYTSLATAFSSIACKTVLRLDHTATFAGVFTFSLTGCINSTWVLVVSDDFTVSGANLVPTNLPVAGTRVVDADGSNMPTITMATTNVDGIDVNPSVAYVRFIGLKITAVSTASGNSYGIAIPGTAMVTTLAQVPDHIIIDRCIITGIDSPATDTAVGVLLDGKSAAIINSRIEMIHRVGFESHGVNFTNTPGPILIDNNYISAAAQNVFVGGTSPAITNVIPSDITYTRNYFFKPLTWKVGDPSYAGTHWEIKNILEWKMGVRVLVEGNVLENIWNDAQSGDPMAILNSNSNNTSPWVKTQDLTLRYNKFINANGGIGGANFQTAFPVNDPQARIWLHDNLYTAISSSSGTSNYYNFWGSDDLASNTDGLQDGYFSHNTVITAASPTPNNWFGAEGLVMAGHTPFLRFAWHNNIFGTTVTNTSINCKINGVTTNCWNPDNAFQKNIYYGGAAYGNTSIAVSPNTLAGVRFANTGTGDYRLCSAAGVPDASCAGASVGYHAATDGTNVGADTVTLDACTAGATTNGTATMPCATAPPGSGGSGVAPGASVTSGVKITVNHPPPPIVVPPPPAPTIAIPANCVAPVMEATVYTCLPIAANLKLPITWSIVGALPPGLSLNPSTGTISGVPLATIAGGPCIINSDRSSTCTYNLNLTATGAP